MKNSMTYFKKNRSIVALFLLFLLMSFTNERHDNKVTSNESMNLGEKMTYRVRYSIFTAGNGTVIVDPEIKELKGKPCYRIAVYGSTTSFFDNFLRLRDSWVSYVDTSNMEPLKFFRSIEEGNYRRTEITYFDHAKKKATVKYKKKKPQWKYKYYDINKGTQDIISLYAYFRNYDYSKMNKGDKFSVEAFFEDELYKTDIYYMGKETIKTKVGKFKAIKIAPVLPKSSVFEGKDAVTFWLTDDPNRMLLQAKIKVKVIPGSNAWLEITSYKGLKHKLTSKR